MPAHTPVRYSVTTGRRGARLCGLRLASILLLAGPWAHAATLYWDTNGSTSGAGGATPSGTWDAATANWSTSASGNVATTTWDNGGNDTAEFSAGSDATGAYTVTLSGTRVVDSIAFDDGTVTLTGGTELTLTGSGIVEVLGAAASIESVVGGSVGLTKAGAGTLTVSGANTYTGGTFVNDGVLRAETDPDALGVDTVVLSGGTTLELAGDTDVNFGRDTSLAGNATIVSDRVSAGGGVTHTLGELDMAGGTTLTVLPGANVAANTDYGLTFGTTTITFDNPNAVFDVANNGTGIGTLTLGSLAGNYDLTKEGAGTLVLAGPSSTTNIDVAFQAGTIRLEDADALGAGSSIDVTLATGTRLELGTDASVNPYRAIVDGDTTIVSDRQTAGTGITHTLGTLTIGAQRLTIEAGGNVTGGTAGVEFGGTTTLTSNDAVFDVSTGAALTLSSVVSDGGQRNFTVEGAGNTTITGAITTGGSSTLTKNGTGTLTLEGTSDFTGETSITGGTLDAAAVDALGSTSGVTVGAGANLVLSGGGDLDRVNNSAGIILDGGSLVKGAGASEGSDTNAGLGALTLSASSTIDFGTGGVGVLAFSGATLGGFTLTIANWTGTALTQGTGSTDRLIVGTDQTGSLSAYEFDGYGPGAAQIDLGGGLYEIVPVPEPGALLAALLMLAPVAWRERRVFLRMRQVA